MNYNNILRTFKENIFPFLGNNDSNKKIMCKIDDIFDKDLEQIDLKRMNCAGDLSKISVEIVKSTYDETLERKKTIEDKAKVNVLGVTIFSSLITALSTSIIKLYSFAENDIMKYILFFFGVLAIFYMLYGGILSLEVLMSKSKIYLLNEEDQILKRNFKKRAYARSIDLNGYSNLIRNNYITSSYQCIRNGLYILLIIFSLALLPVLKDNTNMQEKNIEKLNNKIQELENKLNYSDVQLKNKTTEIEDMKKDIYILQMKSMEKNKSILIESEKERVNIIVK